MTDAEAVLECQREIRRLRGVVRESNEEINNLRIILEKLYYICEMQANAIVRFPSC